MTLDFSGLDQAEQDVRSAIDRVARAAGGHLFPLDFLAWAGANRSLGLIHGFRLLVTASNYVTASSLVRLQLDTALRFKAAWHVDDPHALATHVLAGGRLDKWKDPRGKQLSDRYLVARTRDEAPWLPRVYEETSGFIHLSRKHIFAALDGVSSEDRTIQLKVSPTDPESLTDELRQEGIDGFCAAVALFVRYLDGWAATKDRQHPQTRDA